MDGRSYERPLREDGWLEVPVESRAGELELTATDDVGRAVARVIRRQP